MPSRGSNGRGGGATIEARRPVATVDLPPEVLGPLQVRSLIQTRGACPSEWRGIDCLGHGVLLRYRFGVLEGWRTHRPGRPEEGAWNPLSMKPFYRLRHHPEDFHSWLPYGELREVLADVVALPDAVGDSLEW